MTGSLLVALAVGLASLGVVLLIAGGRRLAGRRLATGSLELVTALLLVSLGALCATVASGLQGYRALTHEVVAAELLTVPTGPFEFAAVLRTPDGLETEAVLRGDQVTVEARILKWHPWVNVLGVHTAFELDRLRGRYRDAERARRHPPTLEELGTERPVDLFAWRERLPWLEPLVDAEYGSGTFVRADRPARYEVRVSTSGLLMREVTAEHPGGA